MTGSVTAHRAERAADTTRLALPEVRSGRARAVLACYARRPLDRAGPRPALAVLAIAPLTMILAWKVANLSGDAWLGVYGIAVLSALVLTLVVAFGYYTDPSQDRAARALTVDELPPVSFLVAVKDEVHDIEACVRSMAASRYPRLEIVVVDDASTDGTAEVLDRLAAQLPVRVLHLPVNVGKKRALTRAFDETSGPVVVFTDSDCVVSPDAVEHAVRAIVAHPDIGAVSGHGRALNAGTNLLTRTQDVWYDGQFGVAKAAESVFGSVSCVSGPLAAFRREAVAAYMPAWAADRFCGAEFRFATDRQLTGYVLGQYWVGGRLRRRYPAPEGSPAPAPDRAWRVEYVRSARVRTIVPSSVRSFLRQQVRWKKSFLRNLFFTGAFQWRRGPVPAAVFYGHVFWVLLAPVMAFRHLVWLPWHGMWLLGALYLVGVLFKGGVWTVAYRRQNPGCPAWRYRPLMSVVSSLFLSWILPYSALTLRRGVWCRR
ncbi:glycosyltransferase family 2 protein [Pseudonocardia endophytica]|uniref:Hyaluronan synthase n=1 Tax=Pseudonocardia endophytica TaxID=401976 RepID=A0A4R1HMM1_PSEEN|nr:glycosyltransferase [Pseudonocardia endophytica]TCK20909.1 cellulose synthase/poly-beta-1,6-N-acetylglucosamine synthase-like glycosyltransferase [Pseudonocardia endophytica]